MRNIYYKKNIIKFVNKIKYNKKFYKFYNDILTNNIEMDNSFFIFMICQAAKQLYFKQTFYDLYFDCIYRRDLYIKHIKNNFKTAYLKDENYYLRTMKNFLGFKRSDNEIKYNKLISILDIDSFFETIIVSNSSTHLEKFIEICNDLVAIRAHKIRIQQIIPISL